MLERKLKDIENIWWKFIEDIIFVSYDYLLLLSI